MKSKIILFCSVLCMLSTCLSAQNSPTAEDICNATVNFLNALGTNNFQEFIANQPVKKVDVFGKKSYDSKIAFPGAINTIIDDTSSIKAYRKAMVYYANTTTETQALDANLLELYKNFNLVFEACLVPNKFTAMPDEQAPFHFYDKETSYTYELPSENLFSSNFMQVKVYIDVYKVETGYFQELIISFTII